MGSTAWGLSIDDGVDDIVNVTVLSISGLIWGVSSCNLLSSFKAICTLKLEDGRSYMPPVA